MIANKNTLPPKTVPMARHERKVAIVDDDEEVRSLLSRSVHLLGATPVAIDPRRDTVGQLVRAKPDLIFLDLALGSNDAIAIMDELAEFGATFCISLISGRHMDALEEIRQLGIQKGLRMLPSLKKPFRRSEVDRVLGAAEPQPPADTPPIVFDLDEALQKDWLELWYQPKVDLGRKRIVGAEALIRLRHPQFGVVSPASFIPSEFGPDYEKMTAFVVATAARDWRQLPALGVTLGISINASITMLQRPSFVMMIREAWSPSAERPKLTVEITEDDVTADTRLAREVATQLRLYDVAIAIDDFGSGYSSFARLRELPFDELKLDKSFVTGCGRDPKLRAFCQATSALAQHFGVTSTAEGVETAEDLEAVTACGFDVAQGYFFSRPMPFDVLTQYISRQKAPTKPKP